MTIAPPQQPTPPISRAEFIALMAMLVATVAFSIDAMLPAMGQIAGELTPEAPNRVQLVITMFVLGLGLGTFFAGPLSDSFGRRPVIFAGAALYITAAALAWLAPSLEFLLAARLLMGVACAAARIVPMAIARDYYKGRGMARIVSFIMMVFMLVPAIAPMLGSWIIALVGWRGLFASFVLFAVTSGLWLWLRVPEPLPVEARLPFRLRPLWRAAREVLAHPAVRRSTLIQSLCFVAIYASLSSIHQIFSHTYDRADSFPYWFSLIAVLSGAVSLMNASIVVRFGMKAVVAVALTVFAGISAVTLGVLLLMPAGGGFGIYIAWQAAAFATSSLTLGNLNAIALEPMGHMAGTATSVFSALATVGAVIFSVPIGLMFNGTPLPLMMGVMGTSVLALSLMRGLPDSEE